MDARPEVVAAPHEWRQTLSANSVPNGYCERANAHARFFSNLSEIGAAKPGQILISPRVFMAVEDAVTVEPVGEFALKGIRRPILAYNLLAAGSSKP